jgi:serine/threonine protein kinase
MRPNTVGGSMTKVWVDDKKWELAWVGHEELGQGGQGVTRRVQHKETGSIGCLKLLSKQKDAERRLRFFREATAYDTCKHPLIPRLFASNTHNHADPDCKLFLVTEFIPGPTLSKRIDEGGPLVWEDGLKLIVELLKTVVYLHDNEWVHRDIKPDNIILRDGQLDAPVLLDFGLSYKEGVADTLNTEHGQEIGNRFLRLPDLSIGSLSKRDERSDLAFVGGILFYVLTGMLPATLQDANGNMPHQREDAVVLLSAIAGAISPQLLDYFDRCFNPLINRRHPSARSMLSALETYLLTGHESGLAQADDLAFIKNHLVRDSIVELQKLGDNCRAAFRTMGHVVNTIVADLNGQFVGTQGGMQQRGASVQTNLGLAQSDNHEIRFSPRWEIDVQGSEIVVRSSSNYIFRLNALNPDLNGEFSASLRAHMLKGVRGLIEAPSQQVVYRGFFRSTPFSTVRDALAEAKRIDRRVFVVLYDDKHPLLSKLDHKLGYFMEYEATKTLVHEHFVVAVVPVSDGENLAPAGPLEVARWFLLDKDGAILDQRDVAGNSGEGLKTITRLTSM